ncbi:MAG: TrkH family potassium uptake protein [Phycisphaerales bacterium]
MGAMRGAMPLSGGSALDRVVASPVRTLVAFLANIPTLLQIGWHEPLLPTALLTGLQLGLLVLYGVLLLHEFASRTPSERAELRRIMRPEIVFALGSFLLLWVGPIGEAMCALLLITHLARTFLRLVQTRIPPGLVFLGSFIMLVGIGTAALMLPAATPRDQPINVIDACFTITSAISQTGLVVRDTGTGFTRLGHVIILIWMQIGALGVIVFGALLVNVLGSSFGLRATQSIAEGTEQGWAGQLSLQRLVTFIIVFTHAVELLGAAVLYFGWPEDWDGRPLDMVDAGDRAFHAVFFSVSAFCNAGFVTTPESLTTLRTHWTTHTLIAPLIVLGSIGFPVLDNLWRVGWARLRGMRLTDSGALIRLNLNTKIVLTTTLALYIIGAAFIFVSETVPTAAHPNGEPPGIALLDAHFMNINRTAGFNTIPTEDMGVLAHLGLIFLMFVGGSPGSVAGGIKVMVFAILVLTVWSTLIGRRQTTAFGRTIPDVLVRKSATLIVMFLFLVLAGTGVLVVTDAEHTLNEHLFEVASALGTCGLSLGVTDSLSDVGRITIIVMMFVGRVGPLAVMAALLSATSRKRAQYEYPTEDVVIY